MKRNRNEGAPAPVVGRVYQAALAVASVLTTLGGDAAPKADDPEAAATLLAAPFAACSIARVIDSRVQPSAKDVSTVYPRTTVTISLNPSLKPGARQAEHRYWNSDRVLWTPPVGAGVLYGGPEFQNSEQRVVTAGWASQFELIEQPKFDLYPRSTWPVGTRMGVYAVFETHNSQTPDALWKHGSGYCGDLQVGAAPDGGTEWQLAPDSPATPPARIEDFVPPTRR